MSIRYLFIYIIILCIFSCTSVKPRSVKHTCIFEPTTLSVIGNDSVDYHCYTKSNLKTTYAFTWLLDVSYQEGYDIEIIDNEYFNGQIDFSICNCKDTAWAKQQILSEIAKQFPYKIIDTFHITKYYNFVFRDTSNLSYPRPIADDFYGNEDLGNGIELIYSANYPGYILLECLKRYRRYDGELLSLEVGTVYPEYLKTFVHRLKFPWKYEFANVPYDDFIAFMRDSMGVDITEGKVDTMPIKLIKFDATKSKYPDTVCLQKHYEVKLIDSSLLVQSSYETTSIGGNISGKTKDIMILHGTEYKNIGRAIVPKPFLHYSCDQSIAIMTDSLPGRYDIKTFPNFAKSITKQDEYIKMVRDSLGFEIKWIKDELIPHRVRKRYY